MLAVREDTVAISCLQREGEGSARDWAEPRPLTPGLVEMRLRLRSLWLLAHLPHFKAPLDVQHMRPWPFGRLEKCKPTLSVTLLKMGYL